MGIIIEQIWNQEFARAFCISRLKRLQVVINSDGITAGNVDELNALWQSALEANRARVAGQPASSLIR